MCVRAHALLRRPTNFFKPTCFGLLSCSRYIRAVNFQLLEICRPEAVILRAGSLPRAYVKEYLLHQEHLSASRVIRTFAGQVCVVGRSPDCAVVML